MRIVTRRDFAREITLVREAAGLTVRDIARLVGVPASTVGGYFGGAHLPTLKATTLLDDILRVCGIDDSGKLDRWRRALRLARRASSEPQAGTTAGQTRQPFPLQHDHPAPPVGLAHDPDLTPSTAVSTRPPVDGLATQPRMRGRTALLSMLAETLDQPLSAEGGPRVHVLHGLGGCGKSMIALALARRSITRGIRTWWISAGELGSLIAGMQAVAVELGATPDQLHAGSLPDQLWQRLADLRYPWLLVIDNADDPQRTLALPGGQVVEGTGWLRPIAGQYGGAVVTTRDGSAGTWGAAAAGWLRLHPVGPLSSTDGGLVLRDLAGEVAGSVEEARILSERLGGLPLALRLAGRYLSESAKLPAGLAPGAGARTFAEYVEALNRGRQQELFDDEATVPDRHSRQLIGRTWELSLDLLDTRGLSQARPMLRLLSCLRPVPIPFGLLLQAPIMASSALFPGMTARRVWSVVRALADLGLVDLQRDEAAEAVAADILILHPLVRDTSRHHPDVQAHLPTYLALIAELLSVVVRDLDPKNPISWARWQAIADHCASPIDLAREHGIDGRATSPDVLEPAAHAARYLRAAGHLRRAETEYTTLVTAGRHILGKEHPQVLASQHELCRVWYDSGQYNRAKRGFHVVLAARSRALGADHPDTLTTAHYLGRALRDHGQLDEAERRFVDVLHARRRVLGADHPDTLTSLNNVADVLRVRGRLDEAQRLLHQVHGARRSSLGDEHPATLVTRHHLATLTHDRGDLLSAERQFRDLDETCQRVLGGDHPRALNARQALADIYHDLDRIDVAERLVREVLDTRRRVLGDDHPATLATRHRFGLILVDRGDLDAAERELASVLSARRRVLGERHPDTTLTRQGLDALRRQRSAARSSDI